jgi:hypothetical protein
MPTPNVVKYGTSTQNGCIKSKNVLIGVTDIDYGPTSTTAFWNGITPSAGGYTIYTLPSGTTTPTPGNVVTCENVNPVASSPP